MAVWSIDSGRTTFEMIRGCGWGWGVRGWPCHVAASPATLVGHWSAHCKMHIIPHSKQQLNYLEVIGIVNIACMHYDTLPSGLIRLTMLLCMCMHVCTVCLAVYMCDGCMWIFVCVCVPTCRWTDERMDGT